MPERDIMYQLRYAACGEPVALFRRFRQVNFSDTADNHVQALTVAEYRELANSEEKLPPLKCALLKPTVSLLPACFGLVILLARPVRPWTRPGQHVCVIIWYNW